MTAVTQTSGLAQLLNFTPEDLTANRQGKLSEMQHYRLRVRRRRTELLGVMIVLISTLIATGCIFVGKENASPIMTLVGIGVTVCSALFTGTFVRFWLRLNADINGGKVLIYNGILERVLKPVNRRVITYIIRVDGTEVAIDKDTFTAFEHGALYRLYRAPYSGSLLAAERL
jgi:hypothetical protein